MGKQRNLDGVEELRPGTRVKTIVGPGSEHRVGTICPDLPGWLGIAAPGEVLVHFDNEEGVEGIHRSQLQGYCMERPSPDPVRCGAGRGADCCIFLTAGPKGFECQRHQSLRWTLIFKEDMAAQREPRSPYPSCMDEPRR